MTTAELVHEIRAFMEAQLSFDSELLEDSQRRADALPPKALIEDFRIRISSIPIEHRDPATTELFEKITAYHTADKS